MLTYELEPNQYSLRVYDSRKGEINYVASGLIQVYGEQAWVRQISSPLLIDGLLDHIEEIFSRLSVTEAIGIMTPAMARALQIKLKGRGQIEVGKETKCADRMLRIVSLKRICEAGTNALPNLRQKEQQMAKKTVKVKFELLGDDGKVQCSSETEWIGLEPLQVLAIEKHILGGILSLNEEVTSTLTK